MPGTETPEAGDYPLGFQCEACTLKPCPLLSCSLSGFGHSNGKDCSITSPEGTQRRESIQAAFSAICRPRSSLPKRPFVLWRKWQPSMEACQESLSLADSPGAGRRSHGILTSPRKWQASACQTPGSQGAAAGGTPP